MPRSNGHTVEPDLDLAKVTIPAAVASNQRIPKRAHGSGWSTQGALVASIDALLQDAPHAREDAEAALKQLRFSKTAERVEILERAARTARDLYLARDARTAESLQQDLALLLVDLGLLAEHLVA